ncbi:hypothetical protein [Peribacillus phoenicis]|uniref:hypothetical protein n=1 Tax=unclassified Peribacillus TaxID=2675266 RepID=UPI0039A18857
MGKIMFSACKVLGSFLVYYFLGELVLSLVNSLQGHYLHYYEDQRSFYAVMFAITMVIGQTLWSVTKKREILAEEESKDL